MALLTKPHDYTLHGLGGYGDSGDKTASAGPNTAVVLKLNDGLLRDFRKALQAKDTLALVTGSIPRLRIGGRTIDLTLSADAFPHELYASTNVGDRPSNDLRLSAVVSHRAAVDNGPKRTDDDTKGSDEALAALQSSLASYEQEKQARQAEISDAVLPTPKNRFEAARQNKRSRLSAPRPGTSQAGSPALSAVTSPVRIPPTSAPLGDAAIRTQALRTPIIHLLAVEPTTAEHIALKTHIRREELEQILARIAEKSEGDKWKLTNRSYKELDVWKFRYPSSSQREKAIDNAIKAYDRLRLGKDDPLWQLLLKKEERNKGIVLSRLNLGIAAASQGARGFTPNHPGSSPMIQPAHASASEIKRPATPTGSNTPRTTGAAKGDVMKRLLSKDPKKAQAADEAKEKKKKDREAAKAAAPTVPDREDKAVSASQAGVRKTTGGMKKTKVTTKYKSSEIVHSSDDEDEAVVDDEEGEIKEGGISRVDSKLGPGAATSDVKSRPKTLSKSSGSSDEQPLKLKKAATTKPNTNLKAPASSAARASPALAATKASKLNGQSTPRAGLSAPSTQNKSQLSPRKSDSKPTIPSPLGAARPRVASDVSDRTAVGVQRAKQGAETPKGLGITDGNTARKRQDTVTSMESNSSTSSADRKPLIKNAASARDRTGPGVNGTKPVPKPIISTKGDKITVEQPAKKRKADDVNGPPTFKSDEPAAKHRKTESNSSSSQLSNTSRVQKSYETTATSLSMSSPTMQPYSRSDSISSNGGGSTDTRSSTSSVLDTITYAQGVTLAEKFRAQYYPAYAKMYDDQAERQGRGEVIGRDERERLWAMHRRLEQMKREIRIAAEREGVVI